MKFLETKANGTASWQSDRQQMQGVDKSPAAVSSIFCYSYKDKYIFIYTLERHLLELICVITNDFKVR